MDENKVVSASAVVDAPADVAFEQIADPVSGSMNVFLTRTGETTRKVKDYRI